MTQFVDIHNDFIDPDNTILDSELEMFNSMVLDCKVIHLFGSEENSLGYFTQEYYFALSNDERKLFIKAGNSHSHAIEEAISKGLIR